MLHEMRLCKHTLVVQVVMISYLGDRYSADCMIASVTTSAFACNEAELIPHCRILLHQLHFVFGCIVVTHEMRCCRLTLLVQAALIKLFGRQGCPGDCMVAPIRVGSASAGVWCGRPYVVRACSVVSCDVMQAAMEPSSSHAMGELMACN